MAATERSALLAAGESSRASGTIKSTAVVCFGFVFTNVLIVGINLGIPNPMIISTTESMGLESWQVGAIVGVGPFFTAAACLACGWFADTFGRWMLALFTIIFEIMGSLVLALAMLLTSYFFLLIIFLLLILTSYFLRLTSSSYFFSSK